MDMELTISKMETSMLASTDTVNLGAEENIFGFQELCTKESSRMAKSKAREGGRRGSKLSCLRRMIHPVVSIANFNKIFKSKLFTMRASIRTMSKKAMVNTDGPVEISTKDIIRTIRDIFMERCTGTMGVSTRGSGAMVSSMAMEK